MRKTLLSIILACTIFTQGCSVWMTNPGSPVKLDGCHVWAPIIDTVLMSGFVFTAVMADQYRDWDIQPEENRQVVMVLNFMGAGVFSMVALMGYGSYQECITGRTDE